MGEGVRTHSSPSPLRTKVYVIKVYVPIICNWNNNRPDKPNHNKKLFQQSGCLAILSASFKENKMDALGETIGY